MHTDKRITIHTKERLARITRFHSDGSVEDFQRSFPLLAYDQERRIAILDYGHALLVIEHIPGEIDGKYPCHTIANVPKVSFGQKNVVGACPNCEAPLRITITPG